MTEQSTRGLFNATVPLQETTELERTEVDIPDAIVDLFQAHVFAWFDSKALGTSTGAHKGVKLLPMSGD